VKPPQARSKAANVLYKAEIQKTAGDGRITSAMCSMSASDSLPARSKRAYLMAQAKKSWSKKLLLMPPYPTTQPACHRQRDSIQTVCPLLQLPWERHGGASKSYSGFASLYRLRTDMARMMEIANARRARGKLSRW
jgi:hypothetical protein